MYDNHYEASLSIGLDISILVRTVRVVASGTGH
jgi:lipopolysaccharide/colanic/teichoic acid biosynthesis glycosyltransferase